MEWTSVEQKATESNIHTNHSDAIRLVERKATRVLQERDAVRTDLADQTPGRILAYVFVAVGRVKDDGVRILESRSH